MNVKPTLRRRAGLLLGRLNWTPDDLDQFVEVPAGKFLYGDEKQEREIPYRYWIAKYPVTNLQFKRFMDAGGYDDQRWWSKDGWAWRNGATAWPEAYSQVTDQKLRQQLFNILNGRTGEERGRPYWWNHTEFNNRIFPVVGVTWFEAAAYGRWLDEQLKEIRVDNARVPRPANVQVRLPREEEWERAARGVDGREYP